METAKTSDISAFSYNPSEIEERWQRVWEERRIFKLKGKGEKKYILVMFPYPSGRIHMGHVRNYSIGDAVARYYRMKGYDVLHPIGWDAFGLPAENAAIERGIHPAKWTQENISYMKKQLKRLGISYDWDREVDTSSPVYYRWEQKFFIEMLKKGIAYRKLGYVNFCQKCDTVLANEQVISGKCWRCDTPIIKKRMWGWYLRITQYADELLAELDKLDWPERVKKMQKDWIGRSEGAKILFPIDGMQQKIEIFTTRPDTIFGVTFMVLAPEHDLVFEITTDDRKKEVQNFCDEVFRMSREERGTKTLGVFTGRYAVNPFTGEKVPIWVSNYVLPDYGTGAIMAVPAHDERDFEFAKKFGLKIKPVIVPYEGEHDFQNAAYTGKGKLVNSGEFSGLDSQEAKKKIIEFAKSKGFGDFAISYKLRDWGISRQRYWGAPIPVIYCEKCGMVAEKEENLPVVLPPRMEDMEEWSKIKCPYCGSDAKREKDTMDTFVESSWYFLGYLSGNIEKVDFSSGPFNPELVKRYMPVDMYIGGIEHAVLHLLYARFFTKVLRDLGYIEISEPFSKLVTQGMVIKDGAKMSKSKGNVVDPDDVVRDFGADTARCFILFAAPPGKDLEWSWHGVNGIFRFLNRVWNSFIKAKDFVKKELMRKNVQLVLDGKILDDRNVLIDTDNELLISLRKSYANCILSADKDIGELGFNTAIARLMEFINSFEDFLKSNPSLNKKEDVLCLLGMMVGFLKVLSIFAPHISDELSHILKKEFEYRESGKTLLEENWVHVDGLEKFTIEDFLSIPVQINGKLRGEITVKRGAEESEVLKLALQNQKISKYLDGKQIKKVIFVKDKIINIIV
jgi:leucyl-tRNA synthetase